ncbi:MAG TPA: CoA-binding protein [Actinomycetota bacterium]|nr:CoA-binding protein [Actinomycetota bacterium]
MGAHLSEDEYRRIYGETKTIAVVGASENPRKPAHGIPAYLKREGYRIIPVNPRGGEILGEPVRTSLAEIDEPVDVVDVFRPAEETPEIARQAAAIGAKVLWLQEGIHSDEAQRIAEEAGMTFISDTCMGHTHFNLFHLHDRDDVEGPP